MGCITWYFFGEIIHVIQKLQDIKIFNLVFFVVLFIQRDDKELCVNIFKDDADDQMIILGGK